MPYFTMVYPNFDKFISLIAYFTWKFLTSTIDNYYDRLNDNIKFDSNHKHASTVRYPLITRIITYISSFYYNLCV